MSRDGFEVRTINGFETRKILAFMNIGRLSVALVVLLCMLFGANCKSENKNEKTMKETTKT